MATKATYRISNELKKAVHSSDEYEDLMTLVQFLEKQKSELVVRLARIAHKLAYFEAAGGTHIIDEEGRHTLGIGGVSYTITFGDDGSVRQYTVDNPEDSSEATELLHMIFFCSHIRPMYVRRIKELDDQLAEIDNDNTIRGIAGIRKSIRGDKYLTMSAISGIGISTEEDADPYGIFSGGDEE